MIPLWLTVITMAVISLITGNPYPLIAGLILAGVAVLVEKFYK